MPIFGNRRPISGWMNWATSRFQPAGPKLLFEVFSRRYERGSIIVKQQPALRWV